MAVGVNGRVGVLNVGAAAPATLPAYLTSIGKASWYGGFRAPDQLFSDIANTVPVTTDGASWRNWLPNWTAGGFAESFGQSTSFRRLALGTSRNGKPGVYGDGVDWYATLSSSTVLNRQYTVLLSSWTTATGNMALYSHNVHSMAFRSNGSANEPLVYANGALGITVEKVIESTPVDASTCAHRVGWSTSGTIHYNAAPSLLRRSDNTMFSNSTVHEIWFTERLTAKEISAALKYLL